MSLCPLNFDMSRVLIVTADSCLPFEFHQNPHKLLHELSICSKFNKDWPEICDLDSKAAGCILREHSDVVIAQLEERISGQNVDQVFPSSHRPPLRQQARRQKQSGQSISVHSKDVIGRLDRMCLKEFPRWKCSCLDRHGRFLLFQ